jgi:hypothetical protein
MKPHPRIRKTIKWGGAAVTLLLVVVWIASCGYHPGIYIRPGAVVSLAVGGIDIYWDDHFRSGIQPALFEGRRLTFATGRVRAFRGSWEVSSTFGLVLIPLWPLIALGCVSTGVAWRLDALARRRARLNLCPKCHYDRAGIAADAKCPECGSAPSV